jgi:hypothetical protein
MNADVMSDPFNLRSCARRLPKIQRDERLSAVSALARAYLRTQQQLPQHSLDGLFCRLLSRFCAVLSARYSLVLYLWRMHCDLGLLVQHRGTCQVNVL